MFVIVMVYNSLTWLHSIIMRHWAKDVDGASVLIANNIIPSPSLSQGFFYLQKAKQLRRGSKKARKVAKKAFEWLVKAHDRITSGKYDMTNPIPDGQYKQFIEQQIKIAQELST